MGDYKEAVQQLVSVRKFANNRTFSLQIPEQVERDLNIKNGMEAFVSIVRNADGSFCIVYEFKRVG